MLTPHIQTDIEILDEMGKTLLIFILRILIIVGLMFDVGLLGLYVLISNIQLLQAGPASWICRP